jgi:hypothetical protein
MAHPAMEFIHLLDPSPDARFNVETFTDCKEKPKPDRLYRSFNRLDRSEVEALLPRLEALNAKGAAIYVAVNSFSGHRKLENVVRVRGIHADLDDVTEDQLQELRKTLAPTIAVQSSSPRKQHWYWLLSEGEEISKETAKAINRGLVRFGADKAAIDVTRLLRLPGFRNMKLAKKGGGHA